MYETLPLAFRPFVHLLHRFFRRRGFWLFFAGSAKPWGGNSKAVCDAATRDDRTREIVILNFGITDSEVIRSQYAHCAVPVHVLDGWSMKAVMATLKADVMFVHEYSKYRMPNFSVNLWHGIPIKRIGQFQYYPAVIKPPHALRWRPKRRLSRPKSIDLHQRLISSSVHDHVVMTACFYMHPANVINCGLPRNDWLDLEVDLPADLEAEARRLQIMCGGKKLCLYAPTFRDKHRDWAPMSREELTNLSELLTSHGMVLGVRPHITVNEKFFDDLPNCLDLSSSRFGEIQVLLRHTNLLITDYSSCALDFMLTGRPIVSYAPDIDQYSRGYLYEFREVFPGPIFTSFYELLDSVEKICTDDRYRQRCRETADRVFHLFHERGRKNVSDNLVDEIHSIRDSRLL